MARLFDDASNEYLRVNSAPVSAAPLTFAAWYARDDAANAGIVMSLHPDWSTGWYLRTRADGKAWFAVSGGVAETTTSADDTSWHHICGIEYAADNRAVLLDGGGKGTNSTPATPTPAITTIGARAHSGGVYRLFSGRLAEVAIWNAALTDAEGAILAASYSPLFVRPQSLVAYWSLIRDEDQDRIGGYDLTAYNTPGIATHPPIIYPAPPMVLTAPAGAPPTDMIVPIFAMNGIHSAIFGGQVTR